MSWFSGTFRSMQQPRVMQRFKVEGGDGDLGLGRRKDEEEAKKHGRGRKKDRWSYL